VARSVTDDLGYAALADVAHALEGVTEDYRIIGGHMVTMLAARWQLGMSRSVKTCSLPRFLGSRSL
jgi:hypothetical protein